MYEYGEDAGHAFIAMEFVEGKSLRDYFRLGVRFSVRDTVSVMVQLLDALEHAHLHSVWHRDIKPANIIITTSGRMKLADFGIARIEGSDRTKTNMLLGTAGYIAPEYYLSATFDHRVDIFAAGGVFYELLTGQAPFRGTQEAIMFNTCYVDPEPPSVVTVGQCPPQFDAIIARALKKTPDERYPSASAMREAILAVNTELASDAASDTTVIMAPLRTTEWPSVPSVNISLMSGPKFADGTHSPTLTPPPTGWDATVLARVERELAKLVGPMARVLARRAAHEHRELETLASALADSHTSAAQREAFLAGAFGEGPGVSNSGQSSRRTTPSSQIVNALVPADTTPSSAFKHGLSAAETDRVTRTLTSYIGPIAKIVVKRAVAAQLDRREFFARLAAAIDAKTDSERFLREVRA